MRRGLTEPRRPPRLRRATPDDQRMTARPRRPGAFCESWERSRLRRPMARGLAAWGRRGRAREREYAATRSAPTGSRSRSRTRCSSFSARSSSARWPARRDRRPVVDTHEEQRHEKDHCRARRHCDRGACSPQLRGGALVAGGAISGQLVLDFLFDLLPATGPHRDHPVRGCGGPSSGPFSRVRARARDRNGAVHGRGRPDQAPWA
jgi:hypothetical protein